MNEKFQNAFLGSLVADAVAMPVHWYYNTEALDRDFPDFSGYHAPKNKHPDSILWRSKYKPRNKDADILGDQARYWGQREVHYHQFLPAGENTINFLLAAQLYRSTIRFGHYDPHRWLEIYVESMLKNGWHNDTYVEEYHRAFFDNRARGLPLEKCGIDDKHIGGLAAVPALLAALDAIDTLPEESQEQTIISHVRLTHRNVHVERATSALSRMLKAMADGAELREAIAANCKDWATPDELEAWSRLEDREVVGRILSPACYLPVSFTASLFISWKYADKFSAGVIANAKVGGDNCHRGAVVGSLLAAANDIDPYWLKNIKTMERLRCDTLEATF